VSTPAPQVGRQTSDERRTDGRTSVLYLITDLDVGGAERVLLEVVRRLDRQRFEPTVCSLAPAGALAAEFADLSVPVFDLGMTHPWHLPRARRLLGLLRHGEFDILHTHLFHANVLGRVLARLAGVSVVVSTIHVAEPRRWQLLLERWTAPLASRLVTVSEGVRRHLVERAHIPAERITVIPNGVDPARFRLRRGRFRRSEDIASTTFLITTVGRLHTQKGIRYLLKAARLVLSQRPEVLFLIVGQGPERDRLLQLRDQLGLRDRVRLLGFRPDVPQILIDSDAFVLPSLWEGLSIAMLEAMAAGLPVVVSDVAGAREVVTDGVTGLVVRPGDPTALARVAERLLDDASLRKRLAQAGRRLVLQQFKWEKVVSDTVALYDRLLADRRLAPG